MSRYSANFECDLADLAAIRPEQTAHLCIDLQRYYFDGTLGHLPEIFTTQARGVAQKIAGLAPEFNRLGLRKTVWVYHASVDKELFLARPEPEDEIFPKPHFSAFDATTLKDKLSGWGVDTLLVSGGYAKICVLETVKDALARGFKIFLMEDCVQDYGSLSVRELREIFSNSQNIPADKGARFVTADAVHKHLSAAVRPAP